MSYQRVTTLSDMLDDKQGLIDWATFAGIKGVCERPDLRALVDGITWQTDKTTAKSIVRQAKDAAATQASANLGTALHRFTERVDRGEIDVDQVPEEWRADIAAYRHTMTAHGVKVHPQWIERVCVNTTVEAAGTFDRLVMIDGQVHIADLKTGSVEYGGLKMAAQLACYANASDVWVGDAADVPRDRWGRYDLPDPTKASTGTYERMIEVNRERALIIHLPVGTGTCALHWIDIARGWEAAQVAAQVRDLRKWGRKALTPIEVS